MNCAKSTIDARSTKKDAQRIDGIPLLMFMKKAGEVWKNAKRMAEWPRIFLT